MNHTCADHVPGAGCQKGASVHRGVQLYVAFQGSTPLHPSVYLLRFLHSGAEGCRGAQLLQRGAERYGLGRQGFFAPLCVCCAFLARVNRPFREPPTSTSLSNHGQDVLISLERQPTQAMHAMRCRNPWPATRNLQQSRRDVQDSYSGEGFTKPFCRINTLFLQEVWNAC